MTVFKIVHWLEKYHLKSLLFRSCNGYKFCTQFSDLNLWKFSFSEKLAIDDDWNHLPTFLSDVIIFRTKMGTLELTLNAIFVLLTINKKPSN